MRVNIESCRPYHLNIMVTTVHTRGDCTKSQSMLTKIPSKISCKIARSTWSLLKSFARLLGPPVSRPPNVSLFKDKNRRATLLNYLYHLSDCSRLQRRELSTYRQWKSERVRARIPDFRVRLLQRSASCSIVDFWSISLDSFTIDTSDFAHSAQSLPFSDDVYVHTSSTINKKHILGIFWQDAHIRC